VIWSTSDDPPYIPHLKGCGFYGVSIKEFAPKRQEFRDRGISHSQWIGGSRLVGLQVVAVVEAKRQSKDVSGNINQAKWYSRRYQSQV
ncbi:hypothetical protein, partial [Coleofasciculus sp.]|uniref:hypothetical protein n=1 Tax=Coleofasciculus sp. TaxID=3100458 RepID=UPI0039F9307E